MVETAAIIDASKPDLLVQFFSPNFLLAHSSLSIFPLFFNQMLLKAFIFRIPVGGSPLRRLPFSWPLAENDREDRRQGTTYITFSLETAVFPPEGMRGGEGRTEKQEGLVDKLKL